MILPGLCHNLSDVSNGFITYTPPRQVSPILPSGQRYRGTVATYSCSPGYQLVGGSSLRACGPDGTWNGTELSCGKQYLSDVLYTHSLYHTSLLEPPSLTTIFNCHLNFLQMCQQAQ